MKPGCFPLGSAQSRAAARALIVARKASESDDLRFETVSIVDGSKVNFDGLADQIRAARLRDQAEGLSPLHQGIKDGQESNPDSLSERIRKARERAAIAS